MIDAVALQALRDAAGEAAVLEHDPIALDGVKVGLTLAPGDADALAATLARCQQHGVPVLVRGGGSRLGLGNRPDERAAAWLSTAALSEPCQVEAEEGVVFAPAGTAVGELAAAAREAGWVSPLEPVGPTSTVGGGLATAAIGPRALGFGRPRDFVLGLEVALASGERTRCGARVVKNVSGYDLVKLHLGAFGTLGVLTGAWLRLRPAPELERTLLVRPHAAGDALPALAIAAARRPGVRVAAWLDEGLSGRVGGDPDAPCLLVELASDAPVVDETEAQLRSQADVSHAPEGVIASLCGLANASSRGSLRFRISAPITKLSSLRADLRGAGASMVLHPGLSMALAFFPLDREDETEVDRACRAVRASLAGSDGNAVLEHAPAWAKEGRDVFAASRATLPLMRALKRQFDPDRILNPGRFVGGL